MSISTVSVGCTDYNKLFHVSILTKLELAWVWVCKEGEAGRSEEEGTRGTGQGSCLDCLRDGEKKGKLN